jgi:hypothetical protein
MSALIQGTDRLELSSGSDYDVEVINQNRYNKRFSKGQGGRPYQLLYSRAYPDSEIRFDNAPSAGDVLVMDVLVNRVGVDRLDSDVRVHGDAIRWLRYQLAKDLAPEYGKELSQSQENTLSDAYNALVAGNLRTNTLQVDRAMRVRPAYDINRGDP